MKKAIIAGFLIFGFAVAVAMPEIEISIKEKSAYAGADEED